MKNGSEAEDYAAAYNDPEGRYHIGVICDGHSDKNCFRSAKGAQFGCESAVEILSRFFNLYFAQPEECRRLPAGFEDRLKRSLKLCWDKKVYSHLRAEPLQPEELLPLTSRVRGIYESGQGLLNIYGATFLAIGMCEDFFIALHIGDGIILCIDEDGTYYSPVPDDEKSETGAPASLCDTDLLTRENAFRTAVSQKLPQAAAVSSDGIEDCMDGLGYKRLLYTLFTKIVAEETPEQAADALNESQKKYFQSCLAYYADEGHGAEDDCSLAAIYDRNRPVPDVRLSRQEAEELWTRIISQRNQIVRDYEARKEKLLENMRQIMKNPDYSYGTTSSMQRWVQAHEKLEEQKQTLRTIVSNEKEKVSLCDRQMGVYRQYMGDLSDDAMNAEKLLPVKAIDEKLLQQDTEFEQLKRLRQDYLEKQKLAGQKETEFSEAKQAAEQAGMWGCVFAEESGEDIAQSRRLLAERYEKARREMDEARRDELQARERYLQQKHAYFGIPSFPRKDNRTKDAPADTGSSASSAAAAQSAAGQTDHPQNQQPRKNSAPSQDPYTKPGGNFIPVQDGSDKKANVVDLLWDFFGF